MFLNFWIQLPIILKLNFDNEAKDRINILIYLMHLYYFLKQHFFSSTIL